MKKKNLELPEGPVKIGGDADGRRLVEREQGGSERQIMLGDFQ